MAPRYPLCRCGCLASCHNVDRRLGYAVRGRCWWCENCQGYEPAAEAPAEPEAKPTLWQRLLAEAA